MVALPPRQSFEWLIERALEEDVGSGDVTATALIPPALEGLAALEAREPLVVAGLPIAALVFRRLGVELEPLEPEGGCVAAGALLGRVQGPAAAILSAERTALNFLQRLCGIATHTARFVAAVRGTGARIVDTRKTTPGWRALEKYAVRCGGGTNHRMGLYDGVLIKDNHIAACGSVGDAVKRARERAPAGLRIQVEVTSLGSAREALAAGAELLLVDNQPPAVIAAIVADTAGRVPIEASGGVRLESIAAIAHAGVDRISIGALTHSAPAADIALEWSAPSAS